MKGMKVEEGKEKEKKEKKKSVDERIKNEWKFRIDESLEDDKLVRER